MKVKFAFKPDEPNVNKVIFTKAAIEAGAKAYLQKENHYGEIGQPEDDPKEEYNRAFVIQDITFNGKEFVGDIDILDGDKGDELREMLSSGHGVADYRIATYSRTEVGDWIEHEDSITITKMEFLNLGIVNKSQVF